MVTTHQTPKYVWVSVVPSRQIRQIEPDAELVTLLLMGEDVKGPGETEDISDTG